MLARNGERPATDCTVNGALKTSGIWNARTSKPNTNKSQDPIRAELHGSNQADAEGYTVTSSSPVPKLCRKLVEVGHHPDRRLEAWRGTTLCLVVRSISLGAELAINSKGTGFVKSNRAVRTAPPMRPNGGRA
jgi:hypothetical protein